MNQNKSLKKEKFSIEKFSTEFFKTLTGLLPPEDGSVRPQTLGKRISGDPHHFILRHQKKKSWQKSSIKILSKEFRLQIDILPVLEELWIFGPNRQMRLEKGPPKF